MRHIYLKRTLWAIGLLLVFLIAELPAYADNTKPLGKSGKSLLTQRNPLLGRIKSQGTTDFFKAQKKLSGRNQINLRRYMRKAEGETPLVFEGNAVYYDGWEDKGMGIFKFAAEQQNLTPVKIDNCLNSSLGGIKSGNRFYCAYQQEVLGTTMNIGRLYDTETWEMLGYMNNIPNNMLAYSLAVDPTDDKIYGCFFNENANGYELGTMDINTLTRTSTICKVTSPYAMMAISKEGIMYGIDTQSNLYTIDKTTGEATMLGYLGVDLTYRSAGYIDPNTDIFYISVSNDYENAIYRVDLEYYYADFVCEIPENAQLTALWTGTPMANDNAPGAPANLKLNFSDASLSGTLTFDAPSQNYGGGALSGNLTYYVVSNNETLATGTTQPGAAVSVPISVPNSGSYIFTVYLENSNGKGTEATIKDYIGYDAPSRVKNVWVTRTGNVNTIKWDAVTKSASGGYFDPNEVTYEVRRTPDNKVIATGLKDTQCQDVLDVPNDFTIYCYFVTAIQKDARSVEGESNSVPLGEIALPASFTFDTYMDVEKFMIVDSNNDGKHWRWSQGGYVKIDWNDNMDMDDWLISPSINMKKGNKYKLSFDYKCEAADCPERLEIKLGNAPEASAMTQTVAEPIDIKNAEFQHYEVEVEPTQDGLQNIGFHGISSKGGFTMYLDNITIESGVSSSSPKEPAVTFVPDYNGANKVKISVTAPTEDVSGNTIESLSKLEIRSTAGVIKSFENVQPGQTLEYDAEYSESGYMTFLFCAYNNDGTPGKILSKNCYIGTNYGGTPQNVKLTENGNSGEVTLSWSALDKDIDGYAINPALVSYVIYDNNQEKIGETSSTTFTTDALGNRDQRFVNYMIVSKTARGENTESPGVTDLVAVGTPYELPYVEPLTGGKLSHSYGQDGTGYWGTYPIDENSYVFSFDPDSKGIGGILMSGKINLSGSVKPLLSMSVYEYDGKDGKQNPNTNKLNVKVKSSEDTEYTTVKTIALNEGNGWVTYLIDLSQYIGKTVQFALQVETNRTSYSTYVSDIQLKDRKAKDLCVDGIIAPQSVDVGSTIKLDAYISNEGYEDASGYTVELYRDGKLIQTQNGSELHPANTGITTFTDEATALFDKKVEYTVKVVWNEDLDQNNNINRCWVETNRTDAPVITDLKATRDGDMVHLTWTAPNTDGFAAPTKETFEDCESFAADNVPGWSFIDADGKTTYSLEQKYPNANSAKAYLVFDSSYEGINLGYDMPSGTKCLSSWASYSGKNDDWAISPLLSTGKQTITFYARSITADYGLEEFEFYTTDSEGTNLTQQDFSVVEKVEVPNEWTKYTYELPEGTTHFAIRCVSSDKLALLIDDVTFMPAEPQPVVIAGYNIYRNGDLMTASPVSECKYTDVTKESAEYYATVVYQGLGESLKSNLAKVDVSTGILNFTADKVKTVYYTLDGIKLNGIPKRAGTYIKVENGRSKKININL